MKSREVMTHAVHVDLLITDYVLGMLPPDDRRRVSDHLAGCAVCRASALKERRMARWMRESLEKTPTPSAAGLQALRPTALTSRSRMVRRTHRIGAAAALAVLLLAFMGASFALGENQATRADVTATVIAQTATFARTPTADLAATAAQEMTAAGQVLHTFDVTEAPTAAHTRAPSWSGFN
jgi:anti-sigma factor RsiW